MPNDTFIPEMAQLLAKGDQVTLLVKGNSMLPFIVGWRDSVRLVRDEGYQRFDVVLAKSSVGAYVLHRIIKIEGNSVVLMGDGNVRQRENCTVDDILAVAVEVIRDEGRSRSCRGGSTARWAYLWYMLRPMRRILLAIYKVCSSNFVRR